MCFNNENELKKIFLFKYNRGASYHFLFGDEVTKLYNHPFCNYFEITIIEIATIL